MWGRKDFMWAWEAGERYPDAAWRPSPLEPPVTTATLPSREKMDWKSWSSV